MARRVIQTRMNFLQKEGGVEHPRSGRSDNKRNAARGPKTERLLPEEIVPRYQFFKAFLFKKQASSSVKIFRSTVVTVLLNLPHLLPIVIKVKVFFQRFRCGPVIYM